MALEELAGRIVEFLFHYKILRRQAWRVAEASNVVALKSAYHGFDAYPDAVRNTEIILEGIIAAIDEFLDYIMPMSTMDVWTVERSFGELVATNQGDYRILKFMEEHPNWKPTQEEPETLVLNAMKRTNFPT